MDVPSGGGLVVVETSFVSADTAEDCTSITSDQEARWVVGGGSCCVRNSTFIPLAYYVQVILAIYVTSSVTVLKFRKTALPKSRHPHPGLATVSTD